jgi:hypothetical protein
MGLAVPAWRETVVLHFNPSARYLRSISAVKLGDGVGKHARGFVPGNGDDFASKAARLFALLAWMMPGVNEYGGRAQISQQDLILSLTNIENSRPL